TTSLASSLRASAGSRRKLTIRRSASRCCNKSRSTAALSPAFTLARRLSVSSESAIEPLIHERTRKATNQEPRIVYQSWYRRALQNRRATTARSCKSHASTETRFTPWRDCWWPQVLTARREIVPSRRPDMRTESGIRNSKFVIRNHEIRNPAKHERK